MKEKVIVVTSGLQISIREVEVKNGSMLDDLMEIVGGWIEVVHPRRLEYPLCMVCNDEGLLIGLPVNAVASHLYGTDQHGHPIVGDVAIMREDFRNGERDLCGLPDGVVEDVFAQLTKAYPDLKEAKPDAADS